VANFIPDAVKNGLWNSGLPDLTATTIKIMGVDHADDTPTVTDDFIDDILSAARVPAIASCPALGSKTNGVVAVGTFDAADATFTSLTGDAFESLIMFEDSGSEATSDLLSRWDTATGLPLTPNGGNVTTVFAGAGILTAA
jgi:hypothetical protein